MKIISFKTCPFVQRVTLVLEAKGLNYEVEYIELEKKPEWFLEKSPHGQVPILITKHSSVLFESEAIVEYIEEVYSPRLHSEDPIQRAQDRAWAFLGPKSHSLLHEFKEIKDKQSFEKRKEKLQQPFKKIQQALQGPYFRKELGWVDLAWIPLLHRIFLIETNTGKNLLEGLSKVESWQKNLMKLDLINKSVASDFEKCFCKRYITSSNYLGLP